MYRGTVDTAHLVDQRSCTGLVTDGKKRKRITAKGAKDTINKYQNVNDWEFATGHSSSGQWTENVIVRGA